MTLPQFCLFVRLCSLSIVRLNVQFWMFAKSKAESMSKKSFQRSMFFTAVILLNFSCIFAFQAFSLWHTWSNAVVPKPHTSENPLIEAVSPKASKIMTLQIIVGWLKPWFVATHVVSFTTIFIVQMWLHISPLGHGKNFFKIRVLDFRF